MSEEDPKRSSHWVGWTAMIALLPVVYILSIPPVDIMSTYDTKSRSSKPEPEWLNRYRAPGIWLYLHVPMLQDPLDAYWGWCFHMYTGRRMP